MGSELLHTSDNSGLGTERVPSMPSHNNSPHNPTSVSPNAATLAPNAAAKMPVKKVLSEAPTAIATPSAPNVRLNPPVRRAKSAATTVIVTPKVAPLTALSGCLAPAQTRRARSHAARLGPEAAPQQERPSARDLGRPSDPRQTGRHNCLQHQNCCRDNGSGEVRPPSCHLGGDTRSHRRSGSKARVSSCRPPSSGAG